MSNKIKDVTFIFISLLYLELVFRLIIFDNFFSFSLLNIIILAIFNTMIIYLLTTFIKKIVNKITLDVILFGIGFVFSAQLVYFKTYASILSIYSIRQANQVMEFGSTIMDLAIKNILFIILFFVPFIVAIILNRQVLSFRRTRMIEKLVIFIIIICSYFVTVLVLNLDKKEIYSAYNLYYNDSSMPLLTTEKLGLITTMRIDLKRSVFGFDEKAYKYKKTTKKPVVKETKYKPNITVIDFNNMIASTNDVSIKNTHQYFKNTTPTYQNKYTGMFKGKNLILILAEALDPIAIDETVTPTLYKLANEGFKFNNFYTPLFPVSTSDGEYQQQVSLIPDEGTWSLKTSYKNTLPFTFGRLFQNEGYVTTAYHGHNGYYYGRNLSMPALGYQNFYACKMGLNINCRQWPESDDEVIRVSLPQYINNEHFMTYYVSISGHLNYTRLGNMMVTKNWNAVKDLPYSDAVRSYMGAQKELDTSLATLISELEKAGKLKDTVIAISPDHYPYGLTLDQINEKAVTPRDNNFEIHRSTFILWNSEMKKVEVNTLGSSVDVLPTIANLFNLKYDSRLIMGHDILSTHDPIVIFSNRSWITDKGRYNSLTKQFVGGKISDSYISDINNIIYDRFKISKIVLERNYYQYLK